MVLLPKIQWHVADHHTLEVLTNVRYWFFGDKNTDPLYALPANTLVFEPRLGYIYWNIDSPGEEYRASKLFPRIQGVAVGASVGVDVRSEVRAWGFVGDGRNDPRKAIWTLNQWLRAGWQTGDRFRLELQETFNWGWFQDDITRMRVGGMNPYVLVIPGLPWSANISERLAIAQLSGHIRPKKNKPQELGLLVSGGAINDPRRQGLLRRLRRDRRSRPVYGSSMGPLAGLRTLRLGVSKQLVARQPAFLGVRRPWCRRVLIPDQLSGST